MPKQPNFQKGFSLIEIAIVLIIVGLMMSAFLMPLAAQIDSRDYRASRKSLEEIKEALYGYAVVNGRLPCPDTTGDGFEDGCLTIANNATTGGDLPWMTLGVERNDPWGNPFRYRVNDAFGTTFTLSTAPITNGIINIYTDSTLTTRVASGVSAIIYSSGKNGAIQPPNSADELENTAVAGGAYDRNFVSRDFTPTFDDTVSWVSPNILFNRMVTAGKLP
ncbi:MAG: prepilin-type N-terminal cleavage/methylation domain-containing protein [Methylophilus sp.]